MSPEDICCSFCGKHRKEVLKMIVAGNPAYAVICDECVELCVDIVREDAKDLWSHGTRTTEHVRR